MDTKPNTTNRERQVSVLSGWGVLPVGILLILAAPTMLIYSIVLGERNHTHPFLPLLIAGILTVPIAVLCLVGFFTLQPNEARVLILFGAYKGTVRKSGFHWANPFFSNGRQTPRAGSSDTASAPGKAPRRRSPVTRSHSAPAT